MTVYQVKRKNEFEGLFGWDEDVVDVVSFVNLEDAKAFVKRFGPPQDQAENDLFYDTLVTFMIEPVEIKDHFNPEDFDCVKYDFFWLDSYQERIKEEEES